MVADGHGIVAQQIHQVTLQVALAYVEIGRALIVVARIQQQHLVLAVLGPDAVDEIEPALRPVRTGSI